MGLARLWFLGFHPLFSLVSTAFWIWMLVDCFQKRGPYWAWKERNVSHTAEIQYLHAYALAANQRTADAQHALSQLVAEAALYPRTDRRWIGHARMLLRSLSKSPQRLPPLKNC